MGTAVLSPCGKFRYVLTRDVDAGFGKVLFVMMNPSTADAEKNDATIRRCIGYTRSWQYGKLVVVNLFAYRATDPADLVAAVRDGTAPCHDPVNNQHILDEAQESDLIVCAWGAHKLCVQQGPVVRALLENVGHRLHYLALSKDGQPCHPLRLSKDLAPTLWGC